MNQKTKTMVLIAVMIVVIVGVVTYFHRKSVSNFEVENVSPNVSYNATNNGDVNKNDAATIAPNIVSGKVLSLNEKQLYLDLSQGKGAAINIDTKTPVRFEGGRAGNLSDVKKDAIVSVNVDNGNNALDILIKK